VQASTDQLKKFIQYVLDISQIINQLYTNIGWHLYFEHKPEKKNGRHQNNASGDLMNEELRVL
jgi:hypothetical protein